jgi:hypothetical protein
VGPPQLGLACVIPPDLTRTDLCDEGDGDACVLYGAEESVCDAGDAHHARALQVEQRHVVHRAEPAHAPDNMT